MFVMTSKCSNLAICKGHDKWSHVLIEKHAFLNWISPGDGDAAPKKTAKF